MSAIERCTPAKFSTAGEIQRSSGGTGVADAVSHVNGEIAESVAGRDAEDQRGLDEFAGRTLSSG